MRRVSWLAGLAGSLALLAATGAGAASLEPVGVFEQPIFITSDPDEPDRLFVVEREGTVRVVEEGSASLFADLAGLVSCCAGERGLLSIAPAPDFPSSGRFYAAYTGTVAAGGDLGDIHVDAFRHDGAGELVREPVLSIGHSDFSNHNGGQLQFGPDGHLYISVGDGGGGGDPLEAGQSLDTLLGKLLRIEPRPGETPPYAVPPGNPFAGAPGRDEIWAYGLRNPWRFSFDRELGDLTIADVGQGAREEVDYAPSPAPGAVGGAGANYGWNCREGSIAYSGAPAGCPGPDAFVGPVFDYPHTDPEDGSAHGCSITGGYVVRDPELGDLYGRYLYGDLCVGQLRSLDLSASDPSATDRAEPGLSVPAFALHSFGEDSCGRVYVVRGDGAVYRVVGDAPTDCGPRPAPAPTPPSVPLASQDGDATPAPPSAPRLRVRASRLWAWAGRGVRIVVRVVPCAGRAGWPLFLNRGGRRLAARRLDRACTARFAPRIARSSSFRAILPLRERLEVARSRPLLVYARRRGRPFLALWPAIPAPVSRTAAARSP